ncbi:MULTISPECIES: EstA family serine hydrolase [unclassified Streptomyces]|nr:MULTISPECIES: EstA family serine hydrolase [unclassified Streptomyces]AEN11657.1 beta-lactamase [Streptomyces sp. SirexAA-E]MYR66544.1 EstA family serine hydrolase [Streptomyces sp. SID4939]MYR99579.1 EstA family serine hydrolase [Streptomyces sp. SID4940]MYT61820.1 EstA family serine hydrolase [Streptomyces sp. SID8357]MYT85190.1 EstA family serine hydrolase [Streptomyces sp. SID8360]
MTGGNDTAVTVHGDVAAGFEGVREEFAAVLAADHTEPGGQLAVRHHGRLVVDLWAGDGISGDSLPAVFSSTKGAAHLVVALLVQDGVLDLERTVASYWPEFAAEGKGELTVRELVAHRSGVIWAKDGLSPRELADDRVLAARLAGERPYWEPGTAAGYHALVIGALTGEVVRRATGLSVQEIFEERVRAPYGLDFHLGLPEALESRHVPIRPGVPTPEQAAAAEAAPLDPDGLMAHAFGLAGDTPLDLVDFVNTREVRALGPASVGGVASARGLAGMYASAIGEVDGRAPLLKADTVAEAGRVRWTGTDLVTGEPDHFALGFEASRVRYPSLGEGSFGHSGAAGSEAFADPSRGLAYGYTRRRFALPGGAAPENVSLIAAVTEAADRS